jgi:hypothetical protein
MRKRIPIKKLTADMPDYLAVRLQDAAPVLGLQVATLRKKCATGRMPQAFKTSGSKGDWRIPFSYLRPLVAQQSAQAIQSYV